MYVCVCRHADISVCKQNIHIIHICDNGCRWCGYSSRWRTYASTGKRRTSRSTRNTRSSFSARSSATRSFKCKSVLTTLVAAFHAARISVKQRQVRANNKAILRYIRALAPGHVFGYLCTSSGTTYLQLPALPAIRSAHTLNGRCDESPTGNNVAVEWAADLTPRARSRRPLTPTGMRVSGNGIATLLGVQT